MFKNIARILEFLIKYPMSFYFINLWARQEVKTRPLTAFADSTFSDKGFRKHFYTRIYDDIFRSKAKDIKNILEIGLLCHLDQKQIGGTFFNAAPSLNMWASFFPNAKIYGFDLKDFSQTSIPRTKIFRGDQSNREDLKILISQKDSFDLIIDDALHASYHQQVSFSFLFSHLSPGGYYIIEDLHYQPENAAENDTPKTLYCLETLKNEGIWPSPVATKDEKAAIENEITSVSFYDSMSHGKFGSKALAIIKKRY
jgi:hypothetical protein